MTINIVYSRIKTTIPPTVVVCDAIALKCLPTEQMLLSNNPVIGDSFIHLLLFTTSIKTQIVFTFQCKSMLFVLCLYILCLNVLDCNKSDMIDISLTLKEADFILKVMNKSLQALSQEHGGDYLMNIGDDYSIYGNSGKHENNLG